MGEAIGVFEILNKVALFYGRGRRHPALARRRSHHGHPQRPVAGLPQPRERAVPARSGADGALRHSGIEPQKIQAVMQLIERIQSSSVNVLINGESGTGKDLAARALHYGSPRSRRPFVAINCAALPENLVESELFGIEKGVATGVNPRAGLVQAASGGGLCSSTRSATSASPRRPKFCGCWKPKW